MGRELALELARRGASVAAVDLRAESLAETAKLVTALGGKISTHALDITDAKAVAALPAAVTKALGQIDGLINNAGIVKDGLLMAMEDDDWNDVLNTNLGGAFHVTRAVARQMIRARRGQIINISSVAASRPGRGQVNYAASKGGIEAATKALAVELSSRNIRVNCIAPGVITTEMSQDVREAAGDKILESILLKRFGNPEDIANMAVFLASDLASYITGEVIHIDGGLKL